MRKDIFEILKYIRQKGLNVKITTNGTLLDKNKIRRIKEINQNILLEFGFEGASPKGCKEKVLKNIKFAKELGLPVEINSLTNRLNLKEIFKIRKLAKKLNVDMLLYFTVHRTKDESNISLNFFQKSLFMVYTYIQKKINKLLNDNLIIMCYECEAFHYINIDTRGGIHFCAHMPKRFSIGNIFQDNLIKIWHSKRHKELVDISNYKEPCKSCLFKNISLINNGCRGGCRAEANCQSGDIFAGNHYCARGKISMLLQKIVPLRRN
jgi:radical SAM protein with 4Fe4S-binding SPASM domain